MNILLAEDNDLNREIAVFVLTEAGAKATCADDGLEVLSAFEQAEAGTFDLDPHGHHDAKHGRL